MEYAATQDLEARYGVDEIAMLGQTVGVGGVVQALQDATEEADSYVGVRYTLPLPSAPAPLKVAVCDIARFRLYKDRPTEEVTYRYERAIKWLTAISVGKAVLIFTPGLTPEEQETIIDTAAPVAGVVSLGVFSDATMGMVPGVAGYPRWML